MVQTKLFKLLNTNFKSFKGAFVKKLLLFLILFPLLFSPAFAVIEKDSIFIYAVTTRGEGLVAELTLEIEPGEGKIWSAVSPLVGTSTQNAERTAVQVSREFFSNVNSYDFKFTISSVASVVEGPSAGAAMTLLTVSMLTDRHIPSTVSITGTINEDGSIGPVGGVFEKTKEASETGVELFLIPRGEAIQTVRLPEGVRSVNLLEYAPATWGLTVAEVSTIDDAISLAFSDIATIDVNTTAAGAIPDFVPEKISVPSHLGSFKLLVTNYLKETRQVAEEARTAMSSTLLEDAEVTSFLLSVLNDSEQTLSQAEILDEQNYLYSAANFGFLARVNAIIVREIANTPSILEKDSTAFDLRLLELQRELNTFENELSGNIPKEGAEWFGSAQQRFTYSRITVERLLSEQAVIIGGDEGDEVRLSLEKLQDYAFAVAWLDVSKAFYTLSLESSGLVGRSQDFENSMDSLIDEATTGLNEIESQEENERMDIRRRLESAIIEKEKNWLEASWFDAASAKALVEAEADIEGKDHGDLTKLLQAKILEVENKIADSNVNVGWAVLFLDHAKYFLASANYYNERDLTISSNNNLRSGLSLAYLSDELFDASVVVLATYAEAPIVEENGKMIQQKDPENELFLIGALVFFLAFSFILLIVLISYISSSRHKFSLRKEIPRIQKLLKAADEKFYQGKIDATTHANLHDKYLGELSFLETERKEKASHVLAVDDYSAEISSHKERIHSLKRHFKEGVISKDEFLLRSRDYIGKISLMKKEMQEEMNAILKQKQHLKNLDLNKVVSKKSRLPVLVKKRALTVLPKKKTNLVLKKPGKFAVKKSLKTKLKKSSKKN